MSTCGRIGSNKESIRGINRKCQIKWTTAETSTSNPRSKTPFSTHACKSKEVAENNIKFYCTCSNSSVTSKSSSSADPRDKVSTRFLLKAPTSRFKKGTRSVGVSVCTCCKCARSSNLKTTSTSTSKLSRRKSEKSKTASTSTSSRHLNKNACTGTRESESKTKLPKTTESGRGNKPKPAFASETITTKFPKTGDKLIPSSCGRLRSAAGRTPEGTNLTSTTSTRPTSKPKPVIVEDSRTCFCGTTDSSPKLPINIQLSYNQNDQNPDSSEDGSGETRVETKGNIYTYTLPVKNGRCTFSVTSVELSVEPIPVQKTSKEASTQDDQGKQVGFGQTKNRRVISKKSPLTTIPSNSSVEQVNKTDKATSCDSVPQSKVKVKESKDHGRLKKKVSGKTIENIPKRHQKCFMDNASRPPTPKSPKRPCSGGMKSRIPLKNANQASSRSSSKASIRPSSSEKSVRSKSSWSICSEQCRCCQCKRRS